ncbi:pyridoxamine 5'-phosphate oxidase [Spirochaetia bacterium]|nr:pyridoxamine 5'-phosphate oxidase [Spirochaetia bacterium]
MRRQDREITDIDEKIKIIDKCKVCRIGICDGDQPYIVPLNFGYTFENASLTLYFHGALEGRKIDLLRKNNRVCFELDCGHELLEGKEAAEYSYAFESIIGFGKMFFLETAEDKTAGLRILMKHQTGKDFDQFSGQTLAVTAVYKMAVDSFTGKRRAGRKEREEF